MGVYHVFAFEIVFKTAESVVAARKTFHANFILRWNDTVRDIIFKPQQYPE